MGSLAKSSIIHMGGKLLGVGFGLATFYALLHFFNTDGYGDLATAITYVTFFSIIVDFGLTITTAQMIAEKGANEQKILANMLTLRVVSAAGFMLLAPLSFLLIPKNPELFPLVAIASVTYFFGLITQMLIGVFQKRLALTVPVLSEMCARALTLIAIIVIGTTSPSLIYATGAFTLGSIVQCIITLKATHAYIPLKLAWDMHIWKDILVRSWPIALSIFFNMLYLKGDILFLWALGRGSEEIGQYASAYKVVEILTMIPVTFMGLMLPMLTNAWSSKNKEMFTKRMQQTWDIFTLIAIPLSVGAWALSVPFMTLLKEDLTLAGQLLWILVPATVCVFFGSLFGHTVVAVQEQHRMTKNYLIVALIALIGYGITIPLFGAWGAAGVTLVSEGLIAFLAYRCVKKAWTASLSQKTLKHAILGSAVMGGALLGSTNILPPQNITTLIINLSIGIAVYTLVIMYTQKIAPKDIITIFTTPDANNL